MAGLLMTENERSYFGWWT